MKFSNSLLHLLIIFSFYGYAIAQDSLNSMIKSQEEIDKSVRHEGTAERKSIFFEPISGLALDLILPLESHCVDINNIEIEGDFSGGSFANKVQKYVIGRWRRVLSLQ